MLLTVFGGRLDRPPPGPPRRRHAAANSPPRQPRSTAAAHDAWPPARPREGLGPGRDGLGRCRPGGSPGWRATARASSMPRTSQGARAGAEDAGRPSTPRGPPGRPRPATAGHRPGPDRGAVRRLAQGDRAQDVDGAPERGDDRRTGRHARSGRTPLVDTCLAGRSLIAGVAGVGRRGPGLPVGGAGRSSPAVAAGSSDVEAVAGDRPRLRRGGRRGPVVPLALRSLALARAAATSRSFIDAA